MSGSPDGTGASDQVTFRQDDAGFALVTPVSALPSSLAGAVEKYNGVSRGVSPQASVFGELPSFTKQFEEVFQLYRKSPSDDNYDKKKKEFELKIFKAIYPEHEEDNLVDFQREVVHRFVIEGKLEDLISDEQKLLLNNILKDNLDERILKFKGPGAITDGQPPLPDVNANADTETPLGPPPGTPPEGVFSGIKEGDQYYQLTDSDFKSPDSVTARVNKISSYLNAGEDGFGALFKTIFGKTPQDQVGNLDEGRNIGVKLLPYVNTIECILHFGLDEQGKIAFPIRQELPAADGLVAPSDQINVAELRALVKPEVLANKPYVDTIYYGLNDVENAKVAQHAGESLGERLNNLFSTEYLQDIDPLGADTGNKIQTALVSLFPDQTDFNDDHKEFLYLAVCFGFSEEGKLYHDLYDGPHDNHVVSPQVQETLRSLFKPSTLDRGTTVVELPSAESLAATRIQAVQRGHAVRQLIQSQQQSAAQTTIAGHVRGYIARQAYGKQQAAAVRLQSAFRGHQAQANFAAHRTAATTFAAAWRGSVVRRNIAKQNSAASTIQSLRSKKGANRRLEANRSAASANIKGLRFSPSELKTLLTDNIAKARGVMTFFRSHQSNAIEVLSSILTNKIYSKVSQHRPLVRSHSADLRKLIQQHLEKQLAESGFDTAGSELENYNRIKSALSDISGNVNKLNRLIVALAMDIDENRILETARKALSNIKDNFSTSQPAQPAEPAQPTSPTQYTQTDFSSESIKDSYFAQVNSADTLATRLIAAFDAAQEASDAESKAGEPESDDNKAIRLAVKTIVMRGYFGKPGAGIEKSRKELMDLLGGDLSTPDAINNKLDGISTQASSRESLKQKLTAFGKSMMADPEVQNSSLLQKGNKKTLDSYDILRLMEPGGQRQQASAGVHQVTYGSSKLTITAEDAKATVTVQGDLNEKTTGVMQRLYGSNASLKLTPSDKTSQRAWQAAVASTYNLNMSIGGTQMGQLHALVAKSPAKFVGQDDAQQLQGAIVDFLKRMSVTDANAEAASRKLDKLLGIPEDGQDAQLQERKVVLHDLVSKADIRWYKESAAFSASAVNREIKTPDPAAPTAGAASGSGAAGDGPATGGTSAPPRTATTIAPPTGPQRQPSREGRQALDDLRPGSAPSPDET